MPGWEGHACWSRSRGVCRRHCLAPGHADAPCAYVFSDSTKAWKYLAGRESAAVVVGRRLHSEPPANCGDVGFANVVKQPHGWTFVLFAFTFGAGFRPSEGKVIVKLPSTFPMASPDMFWVQPALVTAGGAASGHLQ